MSDEDDGDEEMCPHAEQAQNLTTILVALAVLNGGSIKLSKEEILGAKGVRFCIHIDPASGTVQIHAEVSETRLPAQTHEAPTTHQ